ncbi:TonB-dependent receptor [Hyphomonas sp. ND6WE1B]|uniref:TonB-dependent receptor n=1 Tax=Hyphomonas sp. ND6WE1B TaxID=1848191 RepID=UPI001F48AAF3|nr:TonB-dependent receptor [Hyphomonas sp. ND6WE1B]
MIVTATKREASLQDVPFSINAQSQEDMDRVGAENIEDIARNVAGLTIQNLGPGQSQVAIRGVSAGQIVRDQPGVKEQVGIYLDESAVSMSLFTPDLDLFDLARVETLRGPQGTLFGSGSVGGTVRYITHQPDVEQFEAAAEAGGSIVSGGSAGGHVKGMINAPIAGDVLAVRAVGYHTRYPGFIDAVTRDGKIEDVNDGERSGGRVSALFAPAPELQITPRLVYQDIKVNGYNREEPFNIYANPDTLGVEGLGSRKQFLMRRESFSDELLMADLTGSLNLGFAELVSVSTYTDRKIDIIRDGSALLHSVSLDLGYDLSITDNPANFTDHTDYKAFAQELRLASDSDGQLQWLVGGFYSDVERDFAQAVIVEGYDAATDAVFGAGTADAVRNGIAQTDSAISNDFTVKLEQFALFGEVSYDFTDRLTGTFGGRYYDFDESRLLSDGGIIANGASGILDETASDGFSPRVLLSYALNNSVRVNAQAAKGFRLGGVNNPLNLSACSGQDAEIFGGYQAYKDETLWNYEIGFKAKTAALTFNAATFYNDISDLQVTLDAGSCSSRIVYNVPKAHAAGFEYEIGVSPVDGLDLYFSGSVVESEFDSTVRDGAGAVLSGLEEGNRLATVPEFEMSASAIYRWKGLFENSESFFGGSIQHVGTRYTQPGDQTMSQGLPAATNLVFGGFDGTQSPQSLVDAELNDYTLLNVFAGLDLPESTIQFYVNNILDESPQYSLDRERGGRARLGVLVGQPRTFGFRVKKTF